MSNKRQKLYRTVKGITTHIFIRMQRMSHLFFEGNKILNLYLHRSIEKNTKDLHTRNIEKFLTYFTMLFMAEMKPIQNKRIDPLLKKKSSDFP